MTVTKSGDMNWKSYLKALLESPSKISDIERVEFAGYLLRRDMESMQNPASILGNIFSIYKYEIGDIIAAFLIAESPDTTFDLTQSIKTHVVDYYKNEIDGLLNEMFFVTEEDKKEDPRQEYDPNV